MFAVNSNKFTGQPEWARASLVQGRPTRAERRGDSGRDDGDGPIEQLEGKREGTLHRLSVRLLPRRSGETRLLSQCFELFDG